MIAWKPNGLARRPDHRMRAPAYPSRLVILGHPVAQSRSPIFQNAALEYAGLTQRYTALDVAPDALAETLRVLATEHAGGNVTMPHKQAVFLAAHRTSALAARVGSMNTFWHEDGELVGHNTDVAGVLATVRALCPTGVRDAQCTVLGAGGAAAAVFVALDELGCRNIRVCARTASRAELLAERVRVNIKVFDTVEAAVQGSAIVINATPIGMRGNEVPIAPARLSPNAVVFDLVYRPDTTPWVRQARLQGLRAEDGLRMLIEQGAEAFRSWFNTEPSTDIMRRAIGAHAVT